LTLRDAAILSICGHVGCLPCIRACASDSRCNHAHCAAHVNIHHIVSSQTLGLDDGNWVEGGMYGHKLTTIVRKAKEIVDGGKDRLIVFCQFDDLIAKVMDALKDAAVDVLTLTGTVTQMVKAVSVFQKEKPSKSDPRVLLLKMDDEQSAGLNLTGLNHAIFVHPLLANSQVEYDAYETQAIGRIRRYGQSKTVHVWRYFANHTIDTDIKAKFQRK
jgi:SNF2 family DNA or RNA helicase